MLANWFDVEVPHASKFGMLVDASNNSIETIDGNGPAAAAGLQAGDLIVSIDGGRITEFDAQSGPVGGTLLITSEPQSIYPAAEAINPNVGTHVFRILRLLDGATTPAAPPPQPPAALQPPTAAAQQLSRVEDIRPTTQEPPWEQNIFIPDATFGAGGSTDAGWKNKYNITSALPPAPELAMTHEVSMRKTIFSGRPSNLIASQQRH